MQTPDAIRHLVCLGLLAIATSACQSSADRELDTANSGERGPFAVAELEPASGSNVRGTIFFTRETQGTRVTGQITGLTPGEHGFHMHEKGDCSAPDASSAGGHFNPTGAPHGAPHSATHHAGDFGNITADGSGSANVSLVMNNLPLDGTDGILGKSLIVHADPDDLSSQPSGNAGARVACGVIRRSTR